MKRVVSKFLSLFKKYSSNDKRSNQSTSLEMELQEQEHYLQELLKIERELKNFKEKNEIPQ